MFPRLPAASSFASEKVKWLSDLLVPPPCDGLARDSKRLERILEQTRRREHGIRDRLRWWTAQCRTTAWRALPSCCRMARVHKAPSTDRFHHRKIRQPPRRRPTGRRARDCEFASAASKGGRGIDAYPRISGNINTRHFPDMWQPDLRRELSSSRSSQRSGGLHRRSLMVFPSRRRLRKRSRAMGPSTDIPNFERMPPS